MTADENYNHEIPYAARYIGNIFVPTAPHARILIKHLDDPPLPTDAAVRAVDRFNHLIAAPGEFPVRIRALDQRDDLSDFTCENPLVTHFCRWMAKQYQARQICEVYVVEDIASATCVGLYTLGFAGLSLALLPEVIQPLTREDLPPGFSEPVRLVPFALIGRFAVDARHQRRGLGALLVAHAFRIALEVQDTLDLETIAVDLRHSSAGTRAFSEHYGFKTQILAGDRAYLHMALKTVRALPWSDSAFDAQPR